MIEGTHKSSTEASAPIVWYRGAIRRHTQAEMVVVALARIGAGTRSEVGAACLAAYPDVFAMTREGLSAAHRVSIAFTRAGKARRNGWVKHHDDGRFEITPKGRKHAAKVAAQIESDRRG